MPVSGIFGGAAGLVALAALSGCPAAEPATTIEGAATDDVNTGCARTPDEVIAQLACPLSQVCPPTLRYGGVLGCGGPLERGKAYSSDERCVLAALAAGAPARIVLREACGGASEELTLDLLGAQELVLVGRRADPCDACGCDAGVVTWGSVDRCTLVDLSFFGDCLEATDPGQRLACMTPENWFVGCGPAEPACAVAPP